MEYQPNKPGVTELYALEMSRALKKEGCRVVLVFASTPCKELKEKYIASGATIETLSKAVSSDYEMFTDLKRLIKKYKPHILHTRHRTIFTFLPLFLWLFGAKNIVLHQVTAWELGHLKKKNIIKRTLLCLRNKLACWPLTRIVVISKHVKQCVIESSGTRERKIKLIYNGINLEKYKTEKFGDNDITGRDKNLRYISTIGAARPGKGLNYFLDACQKINMVDQKVRFFFVSYGGSDDSYKKRSEELGISDKVSFLQNISDAERIFNLSSVFVCPTTMEEAFGAVITEAMACRVPVVASRVGGIPEIIVDGETGVLVNPKDADAIAKSCLRILNDNDLKEKMGTAARKRVEDLFDLKRAVRETIDLYQEIMCSV